MRVAILLTVVSLVAMLAPAVGAATLAELTTDFRVLTGEEDTSTSFYSDDDAKAFLNYAQLSLARIMGYLPTSTDVTVSMDSTSYGLPATFRSLDKVLLHDGADWRPVHWDSGFRAEGRKFTFDVGWHHQDSARLYLKGSSLAPSQTVRVFYHANPSTLDSSSQVCDIPEAYHDLLLQEAMNYYERAKRAHQVWQAGWKMVREDAGIVEQVEK